MPSLRKASSAGLWGSWCLCALGNKCSDQEACQDFRGSRCDRERKGQPGIDTPVITSNEVVCACLCTSVEVASGAAWSC